MRYLQSDKKVTLLTVESKGLMREFKNKFKIKEYGWIYDDNKLAELYQASDLFLMPSSQEAFGMMAIEAMSSGLPVLSIKGTSLESITNSPECGLSVLSSVFNQALRHLVNNVQEIELRGKKSLAFARQYYGKDSYTHNMVKIYKDVIKRHRVYQTEEEKLAMGQLQKYAPKYTYAVNASRKRDFIYSRKNLGNQAITTFLGVKIKTKVADGRA